MRKVREIYSLLQTCINFEHELKNGKKKAFSQESKEIHSITMLNMCCANILFHSFSSMLCTRKQNAEGKSCMLLEVFIKIYNMLIFCCNVCTSSITYGSAFIRPPPPPHFGKTLIRITTFSWQAILIAP